MIFRHWYVDIKYTQFANQHNKYFVMIRYVALYSEQDFNTIKHQLYLNNPARVTDYGHIRFGIISMFTL